MRNILQADFPRSQSSNVMQLKPSLLLQSLEHFSPKLSEVTLMLRWPDLAAGAAPEDAVIKLKSFDQLLQQGMQTGGQQLVELPVNTEATIPQAQLDRFDVSGPATADDCESVCACCCPRHLSHPPRAL